MIRMLIQMYCVLNKTCGLIYSLTFRPFSILSNIRHFLLKYFIFIVTHDDFFVLDVTF